MLCLHALSLLLETAIINTMASKKQSHLYQIMTIFNNYTHTHNLLMALCLGLPGQASTRRNIHPLTAIPFIRHPLSSSSICYHQQQPPCSIYMLDNPFPQPLSRSSFVFFLVWGPLLHTPCISSPSRHLFATHAHIIAACSAVMSMLRHLFQTSLSAP